MSGSNSQSENAKKKRKATSNQKMWKFVSWNPEEHYSEDPEQKIKKMQTSEGKQFVTMKMKIKHADKKRKVSEEESISQLASSSSSSSQPNRSPQEIEECKLLENNKQLSLSIAHPIIAQETTPQINLNLDNYQRQYSLPMEIAFNPSSSIQSSIQGITIETSQFDLLLAQLLAQQPKPPPC